MPEIKGERRDDEPRLQPRRLDPAIGSFFTDHGFTTIGELRDFVRANYADLGELKTDVIEDAIIQGGADNMPSLVANIRRLLAQEDR